jgi:hypothetical protein
MPQLSAPLKICAGNWILSKNQMVPDNRIYGTGNSLFAYGEFDERLFTCFCGFSMTASLEFGARAGRREQFAADEDVVRLQAFPKRVSALGEIIHVGRVQE